jgi:hypothetical protein
MISRVKLKCLSSVSRNSGSESTLFTSLFKNNLHTKIMNRSLVRCEFIPQCWYINSNERPTGDEIPKLRSFNKPLALKLHPSTKSSRNRYIKKLGTDSSVVDRRVPRQFHILS